MSKQTDKQAANQAGKQVRNHPDRQMGKWAGSKTNTQTGRHAAQKPGWFLGGQTDKLTGVQTFGLANGKESEGKDVQTDHWAGGRQTPRQTYGGWADY